MDYNYIVVLFKNKVKKKIINKFKTLKNADEFYQSLVNESNNVIFEKRFENGSESDYELLLIERTNSNSERYYTKDEFGRQLKVDLDFDGFNVKKLSSYKIDEFFVDYTTKKKINSNEFILNYLSKPGLKMLSSLNNKIILQNDDNINLFTFKTENDSYRFLDSLTNLFISQKRTDCMFVKDISTAQRKSLYHLLSINGYPKSYLFRHSTTFPVKK
jgi:hypothetical protein